MRQPGAAALDRPGDGLTLEARGGRAEAWQRNAAQAPGKVGRESFPGEGPGRIEALRQLFGWLGPLTATALALAAVAGAACLDRPAVLAPVVVALTLGLLVPLWTSASRLVEGQDADRSELEAALQALHAEETRLLGLAYRDSLTGLPNRCLFYDRLGLAIRHSSRERSCLAVLFLDLDDFKTINDRYGHLFGDRLLIALARRIASSVRAEDTVARLGGDEFVVLLPRVEGAADAQAVAAKVIEALKPPFRVNGIDLRMEASVGVSLFPDDGSSPEALVGKADRAMYRAKERRHPGRTRRS